MIKYDLNIREPYGAGGVNPAWQQPLSSIGGNTASFLDNPIGGAASVVDNFLPGVGSAIADGLSSVGIGPEKWAKVETRFRGFYQLLEKEIKRRFAAIKSNEDLNEWDKYISMAATAYADTSWLNSSNSINGHALVGKLLFELRARMRAPLAKVFDFHTKTNPLHYKGYRDPRGFPFGQKGNVTYVEYTPKKIVKKHIPTSVKPAKIPQTITTTTVAPHIVLPTDSPYLGTDDEGNADDIYKSPWYVVIVVVIIVAVGLGLRWIWKKLKKK